MESFINWLKKHKTILFLACLLLFIIIPLLPFIESDYGFIKKDDAIVFLNYYGTIIAGITGGLLTLIGVWWTIKDQEKKRREDLIAQYKPILTVSSKQVSFVYRNAVLQSEFIIKNKGRGEAVNINVNILEASDMVIPQAIKSKYLTVGDDTELNVFVSFPTPSTHQTKDVIEIHEDNKFHFILEITYNGAFNNSGTYKTNVDVTVENAYILLKTPMSPKDAINNSLRCWVNNIHDVKFIEPKS